MQIDTVAAARYLSRPDAPEAMHRLVAGAAESLPDITVAAEWLARTENLPQRRAEQKTIALVHCLRQLLADELFRLVQDDRHQVTLRLLLASRPSRMTGGMSLQDQLLADCLDTASPYFPGTLLWQAITGSHGTSLARYLALLDHDWPRQPFAWDAMEKAGTASDPGNEDSLIYDFC